MKSEVRPINDLKSQIEVTIEAKEIGQRIKKQYREIASSNNFPGFRKGKAPRKIIDNAFGKEYVVVQVTNSLIEETYPCAIDDSNLSVVGEPDFGEDLKPCVEGSDYTYSFTVTLKSAGELSSYDAVEIEMPPEEVTDKEIEAQIESLTSYYVTYENARANTKVKKDSHVEISYTATDDKGEEIEGLTTESRIYTIGSGILPKEFDDEIIGMKKGDEKEFTIELSPESEAVLTSPYSDKTKSITFKVTIVVVKKEVTPDLTDEWVSEKLGFDTVDALRERITEQVADEKENVFPRMKEDRCLTVLIERLKGEPDEKLVEDTERSLLQDFFTQLQRQGTTFDSYLSNEGITNKQFQEDVKTQATEVAKQEMAIDAWVRHFDIVPTQEEIEEEFKAAGIKDVKATMEQWRHEGRLHLIREGVARRKAVEGIMENAKVTTKE